MRLTSTRITTFLVASAALAGGMLAIGAGTTAAGQPLTSQSTVGRASPATGGNSSSIAAAPTEIGRGDLRVWERRHGHSAAASGLLPGDERVWELLHPWRP
jgi:hypothetical protein